jgi:flagellar motor switch protein FliM
LVLRHPGTSPGVAAATVHGRKIRPGFDLGTHLAEQLWNTEVELSVVLDEHVMRLSEVIALRPGQQLMLNTMPGGIVTVRCGSIALFEGRVGQKNNNVAVKIENELSRTHQQDRT